MKTRLSLIFATIVMLLQTNLTAQERLVIESSHLKCNDTILVFTPANVEPGTPLLYLLHGWSGSYSDWHRKTDIQALSDKYGFTIVTPDGFYNSWYLNNTDSSKMQWRKFFDKELYPMISERYGNLPVNTFITGLSMGGHGAINIFIDDTTRFRAAGSMSGVLNLHDTRLKVNQINEVLGEYTPQNLHFDNSSAINRAESIAGCTKMLLITCGAEDGLVKSSMDFAKRCRELKINNTLVISPGVHSWQYWTYIVNLHLFLFKKELEK